MIEFRTADPLDVLLASDGAPGHSTELPILGVPVRFTSSARSVLAGIEAEYGHWRTVASTSPASDDVCALVRIDPDNARNAGPQETSADAVAQRISPRWIGADRIRIDTYDIAALADWTRHEAAARISPRLI